MILSGTIYRAACCILIPLVAGVLSLHISNNIHHWTMVRSFCYYALLS